MARSADKGVSVIAMRVQSIGEQCRYLAGALRETVFHICSQARALRHWHEQLMPFRLPQPIRSVLLVCKANICRSPLAEAYLRSQLQAQERPITVSSAGLEAAAGKPANQTAITLARECHLSLDTHATRIISADLVKESDLIVVMEVTQKDRIIHVYPEAVGKVVLLGYFDPQGPLEIADPYGRSLEEFATCFAQIRRGSMGLVKAISEEFSPAASVSTPSKRGASPATL